jgi:hypothetical protein
MPGADVLRRGLPLRKAVTQVAIWYPVSKVPQSHFSDAFAAYNNNDTHAAAIHIRKATNYLRLESGRATGIARHRLDDSLAQLVRLAASIEGDAANNDPSMAIAFAKASLALALEHRSKAAGFWAQQVHDKTGYALKTAANELMNAAAWAGNEADASIRAGAATIALGDRLATGSACTRSEVELGFDMLEHALSELGSRIGAEAALSSMDL